MFSIRYNHEDDLSAFKQYYDMEIEQPVITIRYQAKTGFCLMLLHRFTKDKQLTAHIVSHGKWASKRLFNHLFTFIFDELGFKKVIAPINRKNRKIRKLIRQLGFDKIKENGSDELHELDKNRCRYYGIFK